MATTTSARSSRPKGTDRQEVEWRFDAPDLSAVEGWLAGQDGASSGVAVVEGETKELSDTYYDTEDWRVYRAGYALRVREGEGPARAADVTLKSLASESDASKGEASEGEARRREVTENLRGDAVAALRKSRGLAGRYFRAFVGAREARPVFALRNRRRTYRLVLEDSDEGISVDAAGDIREREPGDEAAENGGLVVDASGNIRERQVSDKPSGGRVVGEVALDSAEIPLGGRRKPARLSRVEVEVDAEEAESAPEVERFVARMRGELGLEPSATSKFAAGLAATGQDPEAASDLGPTGIDASLSLGELAFAVLRRQFAEMRAHEPGSRLGEDPEEVHDARVAIRRMRAAIKLFKSALPEAARDLRGELKWIANSLGDVRDLDVQLEQIEEWSGGAGEESREALARVAKTLRRRREEARKSMLEDLDSARYERFETSFVEMLKSGPDDGARVEKPAVEAGRDLLSRRYRKWRKMARGLDGASRPEDYHELRKEGKRLRYALEFFAGVYGEKPTDGLVKPLKSVQDDLGDHQDAIVAADLLRDVATGGRRFPARAAFFAGLYAERRLREAADVREGFLETKAFRAVAGGKAWKRFEKAISEKK